MQMAKDPIVLFQFGIFACKMETAYFLNLHKVEIVRRGGGRIKAGRERPMKSELKGMTGGGLGGKVAG